MRSTSSTSKKVLFWAPRLLCIAFILFLASFALDVFHEYQDFWPTLIALLMHLMPALVAAVVLIFAWWWEWVGALLFCAFAAYYAAVNLRHPSWVLTISAPLFVVGLLFLASWLGNADVDAANTKRPSALYEQRVKKIAK